MARDRELRIVLRHVAAAVALAALAAGRPAAAQLPSASSAALGVADNFMARARGYHAVAWNPAGLGLAGNPRFSLTLLPVRGIAGLDPITVSDLADYEGQFLTDDVKADWLQRITDNGGQTGSAGADVTFLALNIGRLGFQASTVVRGSVNVAPEGAELLLYGNAGRTGQARDFTTSGSTIDLVATSTLALSLGIPVNLKPGGAPDQSAAIGVTVKQVIGHFVARAEDRGSVLSSNPLSIEANFPAVHTSSEEAGVNNGSGIGLDLGAAWRGGSWTLAAALRNVINTFEWDEAKLAFRPGHALVDRDTTSTDFDERPFAEAPQFLKDAIQDLKYEPVVAVGIAFRPRSSLAVSADFRQRLGEGIALEPKTHAGVGVELRPLPVLPLRGGIAAVTGGFQIAGGFGLEFGAINLTVAAARRSGDLGTDAIGMFALSFGGR